MVGNLFRNLGNVVVLNVIVRRQRNFTLRHRFVHGGEILFGHIDVRIGRAIIGNLTFRNVLRIAAAIGCPASEIIAAAGL